MKVLSEQAQALLHDSITSMESTVMALESEAKREEEAMMQLRLCETEKIRRANLAVSNISRAMRLHENAIEFAKEAIAKDTDTRSYED